MVQIFRCLALVGIIGGCGYQPSKPQTKHVTRSYQLARDNPTAPSLAGSYIITFRSDTNLSQRGYANYFLEYQSRFSALAERYLSDPRVKDIQFLTTINLARPEDSDWQSEFDMPPSLRLAWDQGGRNRQRIDASITRVDFVDENNAESALNDWSNVGAFWFAEPNYISRLSESTENIFQEFSSQYSSLNYWWLERIRLPEAFATLANRDLGNSPSDAAIVADQPIIAVLDSGVDYQHPAISARVWRNNEKDINSSSCENDLHGCNTTVSKRGRLGNGDVHPFGTSRAGEACLSSDANCAHGTHVAGLIVGDPRARDSEFSAAVAGTCPVCRVMILRIVGKIENDSGILDSSIIAALKYVALFNRKGSPGVRVINASFGKFVRSRSVGLLIRMMKDKRQALVVAAAGNEDTLSMEYPAAFSDAIAVAAVDQQLRKETFSNFGRWVDISAPGSYLTSSIPGGGVGAKSGTSMAAPLVSGIAGLMLTRYPEITFDDLRKSILDGTDPTFYQKDWADGFNFYNYYPKVPQEELRQPLLGVGVLNANASIAKLTSTGLPVYSALDRVRAGCATIGKSEHKNRLVILAALLALPTILVLLGKFQRRQRSRVMFR